MGSQKPKFQYQPPIFDVWQQLQSVDEDLANEVDNPLPQEIQRIVTLLAQRDRQLEDYLTNLSTGGFSGLPSQEVIYNSPMLTYNGYVNGGGSGVAIDTWTATYGLFFTTTPLAVGRAAIQVLTTTFQLSLGSGVPSGVYLVALPGNSTHVIPAVPGMTNVATTDLVDTFLSSTSNYNPVPSTFDFQFQAIQPFGSTSLGSSALSIGTGTIIVQLVQYD